MPRYRPVVATAVLVTLIFATALHARGRVWNFLGSTKVDWKRDHGRIEIASSDGHFRMIQLRVSGDAVFFDRFVVNFGNATSQNLDVGGRILKDGGEYVVEFPDNGRVIESVDFWYYKEQWAHIPSVSLYGSRSPGAASESIAGEP
jgi:hypothetical protein